MMRASVFRLSPLLLLAAALVALAVLLVHDAPPASADHDEDTTIWSATLTVGNAAGDLGCNNAATGAECSSTSVLTDDDFTYGGVDYAIRYLFLRGSSLALNLNKTIPDSLKSAGTLHVGNAQFALAGASGSSATWSNSGLSWSVGDTVSLSLTASRPSGVTLSTETLAINEDSTGSGTFTVALSADPGSSTTVTLVRTQFFQSEYGEPGHVWDLNAATVSPATLTFTSGSSGNWGTAQTVTVTGVEDDDGCDEQLVILLLSGGGPVGGSGNSVTGVFVTVDDDDTSQGCGGV